MKLRHYPMLAMVFVGVFTYLVPSIVGYYLTLVLCLAWFLLLCLETKNHQV